MVSGMERSGRFTELELVALRYLTGPQLLSYGDTEPIDSERGILMG